MTTRAPPRRRAPAAEDPALAFAHELERGVGHPCVVAGLDEAGRGPLAGPVVAAACVLPVLLPDALRSLADSKKLTHQQREALYPRIIEHALAFGVGVVEAERIDEVNILQASLQAMAIAFSRCRVLLGRPIDGALIDGNVRAPLPAEVTQRTLVRGDSLSRPIMAASILAKVTRDRRMQIEHERLPGYGFASHKGYGTRQHLEALTRLGASSLHRRSFAPVAALREATTTSKGRAGEDRAVLHLVRLGYAIVGRNVRVGGGELDIVATDGSVLCFVEVRARKRIEDALLSVNAKKQAKLTAAAAAFLAGHVAAGAPLPACRFDVVVIAGNRIELVRGAFEATA